MTSASSTTPFSTPLLALSEQQIERRRRWATVGLAAFRILLAVGIAVWPLSGATTPCDQVLFWFFKGASWLVINAISTSVLQFFPAANPTTYQWLPEDKCEAMAQHCEKYDILLGYRDQVRALGRRFTTGERIAMAEWADACQFADKLAAEESRKRAACQRLYGVAPGHSTEAPVHNVVVL